MSASIPNKVGQYRLERSLGHGGMGRVFLVSKGQPPFEARFAMKRMHVGEMDDAVSKALFRHETKVLSGLAHRNIVRAVDFSEDETGSAYLVMEYVDGPSLKQLAAHRRLPVSLVIHIAQELCRALAYCHDFARNRHLEDIVHRDIKPENILIASDGTVKLADFGIAKFRGRESQTATNQFRGTPWYMSPEHMDPERPLDHRSDLFSLGVVLYELLTEVNPFRREKASTPEHAIKAILIDGHFTPIEQRVPILEPELCELVNQLLQQDPGRRPESAQEVLQRLLGLPQRAAANELLVEFVRAVAAEAAAPRGERSRSARYDYVEVEPPPMMDDETADALEESGTFDPVSVNVVVSPTERAATAAPPSSPALAPSQPLPSEPTAPRVRPGRWEWPRLALIFGAVAAALAVVGRLALGAAEAPRPEAMVPLPPPIPTPVVTPILPRPSPVRDVPEPAPAMEPAKPVQPREVAAAASSEVSPDRQPPSSQHSEVTSSSHERRRSRTTEERVAHLHVVVYPWGYVWIDGRYYGESPADLSGLKPGTHTVGISQSNEKPARTERVRLKAGANNVEYHIH